MEENQNTPVADDANEPQTRPDAEANVTVEAEPSAASEEAAEQPQVSEGSAPDVAEAPRRRGWAVACALAGFVCCLGGWAAMFYSEALSIWLSAIALALSILGIWAGKNFWRDLAITSIVACSVLLVVYAIFIFGLEIIVKSI